MKNQDYLYLDHAASTPMRKSAMDKYIEAESFGYANSSGGHKLSRNSKNLLEDSREKIAELLNAAQGEIVFTSGGTEADNWTIKSLFNSERPMITLSLQILSMRLSLLLLNGYPQTGFILNMLNLIKMV